MVQRSREFQVFAKPAGALCNLDCHYCYYLKKELLYPETRTFRMSDDLLEAYIVQQIAITNTRFTTMFHRVPLTLLGRSLVHCARYTVRPSCWGYAHTSKASGSEEIWRPGGRGWGGGVMLRD